MPHNFRGPYGASKAAAERDLLALEGIEIVVLRPPLTFGEGVKGTLKQLMNVCDTSLPLPFGAVENRRSMVGVSTLRNAAAFLAVANREKVAGRVFHVAEAEPYSLAQIIRHCRGEMGRPERLVSVPPRLIATALNSVGQRAVAEKLLGDLIVDSSSLLAVGWKQPDWATADMMSMVRSPKAEPWL